MDSKYISCGPITFGFKYGKIVIRLVTYKQFFILAEDNVNTNSIVLIRILSRYLPHYIFCLVGYSVKHSLFDNDNVRQVKNIEVDPNFTKNLKYLCKTIPKLQQLTSLYRAGKISSDVLEKNIIVTQKVIDKINTQRYYTTFKEFLEKHQHFIYKIISQEEADKYRHDRIETFDEYECIIVPFTLDQQIQYNVTTDVRISNTNRVVMKTLTIKDDNYKSLFMYCQKTLLP